jgi:predicted ester cyclase
VVRETLELDAHTGRTPMVPQNEAVVRRFLAELWSEGELGVADELVAPDHRHHLGDDTLSGPDGVKGAVTWLRDAFPDLRFEIDDLISDGDRVVVRWTARGTHLGTFSEIEPTGRQVAWTGCDWFRLRSGQLVEAFVISDGGEFYDQLTEERP